MDTLILGFQPSVSRSEIADFVLEHKLSDVASDDPRVSQLAKLGLRLFKTPPQAARGLARAMANHPFIVPNTVEADGGGYGTIVPNDPSYGSQWHLPHCNFDDAWDISAGSPDFLIGCIDTGADYTHPDLSGNLLRGPSYISGVATSDDDHGHGTWVAGTMVAAFNNALGVSGAAPRCKVVMCKGLDSTNWGSYSGWASAITYLADLGCRVINMSMGGTSSSFTLQNAVNYAYSKGCRVIAARGNGGNEALNYPAACTNVIAVGATLDASNAKAGFSSYGTGTVDIAAPGVGILTTARGGGYQAPSGTSFASPLVAATVALVLVVNPNLTSNEAVTIVLDSATDLANEPYFGAGLLNAQAALVAAQSANPATPPDVVAPAVAFIEPAAGEVVSGVVQVGVQVAGDNLTQLVFKVDGSTVLTIPNPAPGSIGIPWNSASVADGTRALSVELTQSGPTTVTASRNVSVLNAADATPPVVAFLSPSNGAVLGSRGTLKVTMQGTDNRDTELSFRLEINGVNVFSAVGSIVTYAWKLNKLRRGSYTLTARCWDNAGNAATPVSITVTKN